ncbi:uncharacterized protein DUF4861 [Neolewinella xylanilytica]|uniref:Uncharacterized protein DUF4861 n=1 Tax=Neolewinella xylanilytica TaxID=1514080 RepID=A0A2S6IB84_9BACT|nr:DUF4861 domain-containing protein [Neolewinella xylanilytica]PPK88758.1 uncharacterized protein DUF4861 [Neolewinella xylanilytica]
MLKTTGSGLFFLLLSTAATGQSASTEKQLSVTNPLQTERKDAAILVAADNIAEGKLMGYHFQHNGREVPYQTVDTDGDDRDDAYLLMLDLPAGATTTLTARELGDDVAPTFAPRTQAEISHKINGSWKDREYLEGEFVNVDSLRVPDEHTDHSWYIRYEGPGWESDLVGYRFYLDWRNATDVFGKKRPEMVLQNVGQDGFDSYHEPSDWGMDVLKVGPSLGLGSLATWTEGAALRVETTDSVSSRVAENGPLRSKIRTRYYGWEAHDQKTDVVSELSIEAGSRMTRHDVRLSEPLPNLATGIVKLETGTPLRGQAGDYAYLATWGDQSLAEDGLGLAVIYRIEDLIEITEDANSHVVVLRPDGKNALTYYFLAAWEQEPNAIDSQADFEKYLDEQLVRLSHPLEVKVSAR